MNHSVVNSGQEVLPVGCVRGNAGLELEPNPPRLAPPAGPLWRGPLGRLGGVGCVGGLNPTRSATLSLTPATAESTVWP